MGFVHGLFLGQVLGFPVTADVTSWTLDISRPEVGTRSILEIEWMT